jgi:large subunit ribosomal protein L25
MASSENAALQVETRETNGSRTARRLRREGRVPGVVYGGEGDCVPFQVDSRALRHALTHGGAILDLSLDGGKATPVLVKDTQRDPVSGAVIHLDLLRVRMDRPIQATTILELDGGEEAPGVKEGGILEQITRELNIEALPADIPDAIHHDVSEMEMNDTLTLAAVTAPAGVTLLDDVEETVIATLSPPRVEEEPEEIEEETELVGEEGEEVPPEVGAAEGERPPAAEEGEGGAEAGEAGGGAGEAG